MRYIITLSTGQRVPMHAQNEHIAANMAHETLPALYGGRSRIAAIEPADKRVTSDEGAAA